MVDTVAVDTHVVHHADVDDTLLFLEVVRHSLSRCCHALEESVLVADELGCPELGDVEHFHLAGGVYIGFAVAAGATDGEVLQRSAVATHGMSLEVVEGNHEVVVGHVASHDVVLDMCGVHHGDTYLALFVHDVHPEQGLEAVAFDNLPVVGRGGALVFLVAGAAAISRVALHDGAVDQHHEVFDELGPQVVGVAPLAGGDLHCHAALGVHSQCLVDFHQRLGVDVAGYVDGCGLLADGCCILDGSFLFLLAAHENHCGCKDSYQSLFHCVILFV